MKNHLLRLVFLALAACIVSSFTPGPGGYKVGDIARDFHLKSVNGKMVGPSDYPNAKGFIVTFTCNHCPFAKMYEKRILALDKQFASKGYPVIAINPNDGGAVPDDAFDKMVVLAKSHQYTFPYVLDETQEIAKAYGATNTPHIFVLQKEGGNLVVRYVGAIDDNAQDASKASKFYVADAVNSLLNNKPVTTAQTKAIGCSIKWKNS